MKSTSLINKVNYLPEDLKSEVNDFIDFLLAKKKKQHKTKTPKFGFFKNKIYISSDFDEPLDDFSEYMQ
jgi:uncharacterized protein DUF2281